MKRILFPAYGFIAYAMFGLSLAWLLGFLLNAGVPSGIDQGSAPARWLAVVIDILLLSLFGLQHSVMARPGFKRWWTRIVPGPIERSTYVLVSSIILIAVCIFWQPLPESVWRLESAYAIFATWSGFLLGVIWLFAASFHIDHFELLGLKQVWAAARKRSINPPAFVVRGLYRLMRHPIYIGWLLLFWCTPLMTEGKLLFALGMTIYTIIAIRYEERDLDAAIGESYRNYRGKVPALVPNAASVRDAIVGGRGMYRIALVLVLFAIGTLIAFNWSGVSRFVVASTVQLETRALEEITMNSGGRERRARLVVPADREPEALVVFLHGAGGDPGRLRLLSNRQLDEAADDAGWAVAYPEGIGGTWNDCRTVPDYPAKRESVDDVAYLASLIDGLRERFGLQPQQVLVAGFSNGGHMAIRMAVERPELLAGIVPIAALLPEPRDSVCGAPTIPARTTFLAGTLDPISPYHGGEAVGPGGDPLGRVLSAADTLKHFPAGRVVTLEGAGHVIPGPVNWFPPVVGPWVAEPGIARVLQDSIE